jgi:hypothetical protein
MIVRVNRGRLPIGFEGELLARLQAQGSRIAKPDGMLGGTMGRRVVGDRVELIAVTYWRDVAALEAAFGPNWATPTTLVGFDQLLEDRVVEHFEAAVESTDMLFAGSTPTGAEPPVGDLGEPSAVHVTAAASTTASGGPHREAATAS